MVPRSNFMALILAETGGRVLLGLLLAAAILVPASNLLLPEGSFLHVPTYIVTLMGKYLAFALLALSVDLIWGYAGILSLGHGAFFALGGYAMGMYLMRQIGDRGVYGNAELPDFMVFLNWTELPWYWHGFDAFPFALVMVVAVPGALGVTILTSDDVADGGILRDRCDLAVASGCEGIVCAAPDLPATDPWSDRLVRVVPGIRMPGGATHDQARVASPRDALAAGADLLVVGRAVTGAEDPAAAAAAMVEHLMA